MSSPTRTRGRVPAPRSPQRKSKGKKPPIVDPFAVPVEVTPAGVNPDHLMLENIDTTVEPRFSVKEVATIFFGKSDHWLRLRQNSGDLVYNRQPIEIARTPAKARYFTLADIEMIAHGFVQRGIITGEHASNIVVAVVAIARIHGFLDTSGD